MLGAVFLILPMVLLIAVRERFQQFFLSPVKILSSFLLGVALVGYASYSLTDLPSGMDIRLDEADVQHGVVIFAVSLWGFVLGACALKFSRPPASIAPARSRDVSRSYLIVGVGVCAAVILSADPGSLLERSTYLRGNAGDLLVGLTGVASLAAIALLGYLHATSPRLGVGTLLAAACFLLVLFSLGSRQFALGPVVYALGGLSHTGNSMWRKRVALAGAAAFVLLPLPLYLRGLTSHGLLPYYRSLPDYVGDASAQFAALSTVTSAFPITVESSYFNIPSRWIGVELNPLPGQLAGWYAIAPRLRLGDFVPTSGIGELASFGLLPLFIFWVGAGLVFAYLDRRAGYWLLIGYRAGAIAILGFSILVGTQMVQYNLRSGVRLVYYCLLVDFALRFYRYFRCGKGSNNFDRTSRAKNTVAAGQRS